MRIFERNPGSFRKARYRVRLFQLLRLHNAVFCGRGIDCSQIGIAFTAHSHRVIGDRETPIDDVSVKAAEGASVPFVKKIEVFAFRIESLRPGLAREGAVDISGDAKVCNRIKAVLVEERDREFDSLHDVFKTLICSWTSGLTESMLIQNFLSFAAARRSIVFSIR